jgi:hypothetical protein
MDHHQLQQLKTLNTSNAWTQQQHTKSEENKCTLFSLV